MVAQLAQRLRREDIFLWCYKGRVFDDDETILFTSPALFGPSLGGTRIHIFHPFTRPFDDIVQFTNARRRFLDGLLFAFFVPWHGESLCLMRLSR